jgi:hypothetical protein
VNRCEHREATAAMCSSESGVLGGVNDASLARGGVLRASLT